MLTSQEMTLCKVDAVCFFFSFLTDVELLGRLHYKGDSGTMESAELVDEARLFVTVIREKCVEKEDYRR